MDSEEKAHRFAAIEERKNQQLAADLSGQLSDLLIGDSQGHLLGKNEEAERQLVENWVLSVHQVLERLLQVPSLIDRDELRKDCENFVSGQKGSYDKRSVRILSSRVIDFLAAEKGLIRKGKLT